MKKTLNIVLILFAVIAYYACTSTAQNVSEWRGPNRDGKFPDKNLLKQWPENGPELVWEFNELGLGFSSPAFTKDGFFICGTNETDSIGSVFSFDLDGNLLWKKAYGKEFMTNFPGSRSTPTVAGDLGYIMSGLGVVYCFNADNGEAVWSIDLVKDYGAEIIQFGNSEVLLVNGDVMYITAGGKEHNILAVNRHDGSLVWSSEGTGLVSAHCPPMIFEHNGKEYLATFTKMNAVAVDITNGDVAWTYEMTYKHGIHANSPIYKDGHIFVQDAWRLGSYLLKISEDGKSVERVWKNNLMDLENGDAILIGDRLYGTNWKEKGISCVDWNTGEELFTNKEFQSGTLIFADDMFYIYSIIGEVGLVKANNDSFEVVSKFSIPGERKRDHSAHPVIHNKKIYLRYNNHIYAYNISN